MGAIAVDASPTDHLRVNQQAFLLAFMECGSITDAAEAVGIARTTHYDWLDAEGTRALVRSEEQAPEGTYAHAFLRAKEIAADTILERSEAHARSTATDMPATVNRMFHIKRWYPQYRDQLNVKHSGAVLQARVDLNQLSPSERVELAGLLTRRLLASGSGESNVAVDESVSEDGGG